MIPDWLANIVFPIMRWLHIVGTTLLVGGTLFFEFVVPEGIADLREEQQLAVFARCRWVFRRIVWFCAIVLPITGGVSIYRIWNSYERYPNSFQWMLAHAALSLLTLAVAIRLVHGRGVPPHSRRWMQVSFMMLLVTLFLASTARHVRLLMREREQRQFEQTIRSMDHGGSIMRLNPQQPPVEGE